MRKLPAEMLPSVSAPAPAPRSKSTSSLLVRLGAPLKSLVASSTRLPPLAARLNVPSASMPPVRARSNMPPADVWLMLCALVPRLMLAARTM